MRRSNRFELLGRDAAAAGAGAGAEVVAVG